MVCAAANNIVSFSGGKDSTAMLHMMLERGEKIADVVFFDTGWEFPEMLDHVAEVEKKTGLSITRLTPERPFEYWMFERQIKARKGPCKGEIHRIGNGWPSPTRRWCTRIKVDAIEKHIRQFENPVCCVGIAVDERASAMARCMWTCSTARRTRITRRRWSASRRTYSA